ncbi:MAG: hypothetical protein Q9180_005006 [Flavoplaca navasiana]
MPMRDYVIMEFVNLITDKPDWELKVFDESIIAKWKAEILVSNSSEADPSSVPANMTRPSTLTDDGPSPSSGSEHGSQQQSVHHQTANVSPRMFDWIIAEVKYKAELFKQFNCIEALDGVWKSDSLISIELKKALEKAVRPLEEVPENRALATCEYVKAADIAAMRRLKRTGILDPIVNEWSQHYQWLPTEFEVPPNTVDVNVKSYINNLHPRRHSDLYSIISKIIVKAIPLWERVLSRIIAPPMQPRVSDWSDSFQGYAQSEPVYDFPDREEDEDDLEYDMRLDDGEHEDLRDIIEPEPGNFKTPAERMRDYKILYGLNPPMPKVAPCVDLRKDYGHLQIIVKLANIHLDPKNSEYPGGSWHVEGQANESICASALYYYSSENVTDSYLSFRQQTHDGAFRLDHPQDEWKAVEQIYGFKNGEPTIQTIGKVLTQESRLLCFPNVMQHKVSSFKLVDPSKSGHRKLLALFLVDPHIKIISTENVPPQQHAWWKENVEAAGVFQKLPPELAEMVLDGEGFPITLETARQQRLELMEERKEFALHSEDLLKEKTFNLCEH